VPVLRSLTAGPFGLADTGLDCAAPPCSTRRRLTATRFAISTIKRSRNSNDDGILQSGGGAASSASRAVSRDGEANASARLARKENDLGMAKATLDKAKATLDKAKATLDKAKATLDKAKATLDKAKGTLRKAKAGKDEVEVAEAKVEVAEAEDGVAKAEVEVAKAEVEVAKAEVEVAVAHGDEKAKTRALGGQRFALLGLATACEACGRTDEASVARELASLIAVHIGQIDASGLVAHFSSLSVSSPPASVEASVEFNLPEQAACGDVDSVLEVQLLPGFMPFGGSARLSEKLFMRKNARDQWISLNDARTDPNTRSIIISGLPGLGKSTITWAWASWLRSQGASTLFIRLKPGATAQFCLLKPDSNLVAYGKIAHIDASFPIHSYDVNVLVIDGVRRNTYETFSPVVQSFAERREDNFGVLVTSSQITIPVDQLADLRRCDFASTSFSERDYVGVSEHLPIGRVHSEEELRSKYFYAGSSGRYMFELSTDQVIKDIKFHIKKVSNIENVLSATVGESSEVAVGHLRSTFSENEKGIVSQYAARLLVERSSLKGVVLLHELAQSYDHRPMLGWAFEMRFDVHLKLALQSSSLALVVQRFNDNEANDPNIAPFPVEHIVRFNSNSKTSDNPFDDDDELNRALSSQRTMESVWLIPVRYNEAAFDFVWLKFLEDRNVHVWTFNTTIASTHDLKYNNIRKLIKHLVDKNFVVPKHRHVFVLPTPNACASFVVGESVGSLADHAELDSRVLVASPEWNEKH